MGSMSNTNPWAPYDSYTDCSQGTCNIYCPQWCYLLFPPPPPSSFLDEDDGSSSSSDFSPLLIALIGILASAFVLVSYYTLISNYCHRRRENSSDTHNRDDLYTSVTESRRGIANAAAEAAAGDGLNDSLIRSITVYKYREGDGFVDGSDCSVCLSEFEENESLRLLPKCNHAFHLPCIDTWLKSHSNCPLCRAFVAGINSSAAVAEDVFVANQSSSAREIESDSGDSVVVNVDLETGSRSINGGSHPQPPEEQGETKDEATNQIRRSVSLSSGIVVSIGDVLREIEDEESAGVGTSQQRREEDGRGSEKTPPSTANHRRGVSNKFMVRSSSAMKRSVSTGRFIFSRSDQQRDYRLPN